MEMPQPPSDITPNEFFGSFLKDIIASSEVQDKAKENASDMTVKIGFDITDADCHYSLVVDNGTMAIVPGVDDADMTMALDEETWRELMIDKSANPQQLFMSGRMQIEGDMSIAMQLQNVMPEGMFS